MLLIRAWPAETGAIPGNCWTCPGGPCVRPWAVPIPHRGLPSSSHTCPRRGDLASLTGVVEQDVLAELAAALHRRDTILSPVRPTLLFLVRCECLARRHGNPPRTTESGSRERSPCAARITAARIGGEPTRSELEPVALGAGRRADRHGPSRQRHGHPARRPGPGAAPGHRRRAARPGADTRCRRGVRRAARRARVRGPRDHHPRHPRASDPVRHRDHARRRGGEHAAPGARPAGHRGDRPQSWRFRPRRRHGGARPRAGPGQPSGRHPHPEAWSRRRLALPGREPVRIAAPSRSALEGAGFEIVERREPSLLLDGFCW